MVSNWIVGNSYQEVNSHKICPFIITVTIIGTCTDITVIEGISILK